MKLKLIEDIISDFYESSKSNNNLYTPPYKGLSQFQSNWDIRSDDFGKMYNESLSEELINWLFTNRSLPIKSVILEFCKNNSIATRQMFIDLFYEPVEINSRIDHFGQEADHNFSLILNKIGVSFSSHHHRAYEVLSIYLTLKFPNKYSFFNYDHLVDFLTRTEARNIPNRKDIVKYNQIQRTINTLMQKHDTLKELIMANSGFGERSFEYLFPAYSLTRFCSSL